jgi:putative DNA primase/helicase
MQEIPAKEVARGRWQELLPALGVDSRYLERKHGPCPMCGGKDRYRWDNKDGTGSFFCSGCGPGDGFVLAQKVTGKSFADLAAQVRSLAGSIQPTREKKVDTRQIEKARNRLWESARKPFKCGPVAHYLTSRHGRPWASNSIREAVCVWHPEAKTEMPAMLGSIQDQHGSQVNIHITYLTPDGQKANVETAKRVMAGPLPEGCAVRLWPAAPVMGIAEGIETAISAAVMFKMPVWAAINGTLLSKWIPPEGAEEIHIFGDNDVNFAGQAKAYALAHRLAVQFERRVVIRIPDQPGTDWNDVHKEKGA